MNHKKKNKSTQNDMLHFDLVHAVLLGIDPGRKCVGDQIIVWRKMNIVHICKLRGLFGNVWIWCFYLALTDASSVPHNGTGVFCCHLISFLHYPCHYFYGPFVLHLRHFFCSSRALHVHPFLFANSIHFLIITLPFKKKKWISHWVCCCITLRTHICQMVRIE